ncbi:MAG: hypothetical protein WC489_01325 [Patescibacteria group bacterium]
MNTADKKSKISWKMMVVIIIGLFFLSYFFQKPSKQSSLNKPSTETVNSSQSPLPTMTAEEKARKEKQKTDLATQYCTQRSKRTRRFYPIPVLTTVENGESKFEVKNDNIKKGVDLTQTDCKTVIDFFYENPLIFKDVQSLVDGKYWIDMSMVELSFSIGYPDDINKTNYSSGVTEQWVYYKNADKIEANIIYIENNRVTSYQDY